MILFMCLNVDSGEWIEDEVMETQEWRGRGSPGARGSESRVRMECVRAWSEKCERRDIVLRECRRTTRLRPFLSNRESVW